MRPTERQAKSRPTWCAVALALFWLTPLGSQVRPLAAPSSAQGSPAAGLTIVVIDGEAAVNIVQQKTAVAPVVEVRDRNNQPVAGAVVQFAIRSGRASFAGARTLTVTTNAAGRAVAAGLTPPAAAQSRWARQRCFKDRLLSRQSHRPMC